MIWLEGFFLLSALIRFLFYIWNVFFSVINSNNYIFFHSQLPFLLTCTREIKHFLTWRGFQGSSSFPHFFAICTKTSSFYFCCQSSRENAYENFGPTCCPVSSRGPDAWCNISPKKEVSQKNIRKLYWIFEKTFLYWLNCQLKIITGVYTKLNAVFLVPGQSWWAKKINKNHFYSLHIVQSSKLLCYCEIEFGWK